MVVVEQPHSPNGGQNSSIALDQTGYGAIRRVHLGALDRTFPAPYSPGSALSFGNHCFGPRAQVPPLWAKKVPKRRLSPTSDGDGRKGCPKGPGDRGGHGPSRVDNAFPCAALNPTITRMHAAVVTLQPSRLCSPDNHTARQGRPLGLY